ncbi:hypothetical protein DBADOPDK_01930 [Pseudomonas sp. MM223]|nr:hypothetical protein DBADOPDK_01930 [Pseudomonas sp. MM223]
MKLSVRHIEVFRAIMAAGSVTGAARLLFTSQPTVSRELARLEQVTGLNLFEREGGRLVATAQALLLIEEVERAYVGLERIDRFAQAIRNFEQGRLAITCLPLFSQTLLPKACQRFHQQHRGVSVSIVAQESPLLEESLVAQQHDLGLTEVEQIPRGAYGELLFSANMVCVLPEHHPLQAKAERRAGRFSRSRFHQPGQFGHLPPAPGPALSRSGCEPPHGDRDHQCRLGVRHGQARPWGGDHQPA